MKCFRTSVTNYRSRQNIDPAINSAQKSFQNIAFDASKKIIHKSESEGNNARNTKTKGSEKISKTDNLLTRPK
jgi:hypothetical protein